MLSLRGRKSSPRQAGLLTDIGDDILILICSQCRIDELFSLRLTSKKIRNLIDGYMSTIGPNVARSTFPLCEHLLARHASTLPFTFQKLKALIPEHLASMLVDRHRVTDEWLQSRYGIPAESPFGDVIRDRAANGWRVLQNLSNISRNEYGMTARGTRISPGNLADKVFRPAHFKLEAMKYVEDEILQKRLEYISSLERQQMQDYKLMFMLLSAAFSTSISNIGDEYAPWIFDFGDGIDGQRDLRKGYSWLSWYILAEGPDLFWQQWWSLPHADLATQNYIRDRASEAFRATPEKLADHHRKLARSLQEAINEHSLVETEFQKSNPIRYFARYAEERLRRQQAGLPPVREILEHVPFLVNFRCPKEVVERHELVEEERNLSRTSQAAPRG